MATERPLILCVDDDPDILLYLRTVLEAEGFGVAEAESAEAGIRVFDREKPDLVIVDLMMEEVDSGTGFAREVRLRDRDCPMYLLSSVGDNLNLMADYAELGFDGVFQKPLAREHLVPILRARLGVAS